MNREKTNSGPKILSEKEREAIKGQKEKSIHSTKPIRK